MSPHTVKAAYHKIYEIDCSKLIKLKCVRKLQRIEIVIYDIYSIIFGT